MKVVKAKSAKMQGARTRARAREVQKTKTGSTIKHSSEVRFVILQATNKNIGRFPKNVRHFPKNVRHFPKNVGSFSKNVGHFSAYLPRFFFTLRCTTSKAREICHLTTYIFYSWYLALSSYTHKSAHKRKCNGGMWRQNRWRNHSPP